VTGQNKSIPPSGRPVMPLWIARCLSNGESAESVEPAGFELGDVARQLQQRIGHIDHAIPEAGTDTAGRSSRAYRTPARLVCPKWNSRSTSSTCKGATCCVPQLAASAPPLNSLPTARSRPQAALESAECAGLVCGVCELGEVQVRDAQIGGDVAKPARWQPEERPGSSQRSRTSTGAPRPPCSQHRPGTST
jgi:hypothetical protein